ncbi:MAG: energy transducer TonB, partial [Candidatus Eiseniibacteriota bacterium]
PAPIAKPSPGALPAAASPSLPGTPPESASMPDAGPLTPGANGGSLATDSEFKPPILRRKCRLETPPGHRGGMVELELRVSRGGFIDEFRFAGGDADTALVRAALDCVRMMQFYPAMRGGQPVEAWCLQRFTFDR